MYMSYFVLVYDPASISGLSSRSSWHSGWVPMIGVAATSNNDSCWSTRMVSISLVQLRMCFWSIVMQFTPLDNRTGVDMDWAIIHWMSQHDDYVLRSDPTRDIVPHCDNLPSLIAEGEYPTSRFHCTNPNSVSNLMADSATSDTSAVWTAMSWSPLLRDADFM